MAIRCITGSQGVWCVDVWLLCGCFEFDFRRRVSPLPVTRGPACPGPAWALQTHRRVRKPPLGLIPGACIHAVFCYVVFWCACASPRGG